MAVTLLNTENFDEMTQKSEKCLIDFFASWCGPCNMLSPLIDDLSEELDDLDFFKVDCDESLAVAERLGVNSIPALFVMKDGEIVAKSVGYMPLEKLRKFIEEA